MVDAEPLGDAHPRRRAAAAEPARHAPGLRRGRHARRRRPLPAHRRLPQDRQRRDVPVLHGHARGGARHPRARQRARQGAVASPTPRAALGDERLHEILDLCLECKACKSECPLGVDMASMKSRVPLALQRDPRHAAALAAVRLDPHAQPARLGDRAAVEPAGRRGGCWRRSRASTAGGRCRASSARR